ncbi:MAG: hypothetical protein NTX72_05945 [Candidatus Uhrbacteria bacterium]|nr:hypothetical protein [Candidatus Uhrbacteria bacterium]
MARRILQTKKGTESFLVPVLLFVCAASFFVVFARAPEHIVATSSDRVVSAEGVSREATAVQILRLTNVEQSIPLMRGPVYELSVRGGGVLTEAVIQYRIPANIRPSSSTVLTLIAFDPQSLSWKPIPTVIDEKNTVARAQTSVQQTLMIGLGTKF